MACFRGLPWGSEFSSLDMHGLAPHGTPEFQAFLEPEQTGGHEGHEFLPQAGAPSPQRLLDLLVSTLRT